SPACRASATIPPAPPCAPAGRDTRDRPATSAPTDTRTTTATAPAVPDARWPATPASTAPATTPPELRFAFATRGGRVRRVTRVRRDFRTTTKTVSATSTAL